MSDFEPRTDKWRSQAFEDLGMQFKDAIFNKGRTERERRAARRAAERHMRRMKNPIWRFWWNLKKAFWAVVTILIFAPFIYVLWLIASVFFF